MTSDIKVTNLIDFDEEGAYCTLLEYKGLKVLVDCGLPLTFDATAYNQNFELLKNLDLILITSSEIEHCGALCLLISRYNYYVK
jgi:Cft2 family RNA processing exonuclease